MRRLIDGTFKLCGTPDSRPNLRPVLGAAKVRLQSWQTTILELIGTFVVLVAIAAGILALRFGLIVLHDVVR